MKLNFRNVLPGLDVGSKVMSKDYLENDIAKAFGNSLKKLRAHKKMSLNELSKEVDMPNPTINRYESGYHLPLITQGMKLAGYFDLTIECMVFFGLVDMEGETPEGKDIVAFYEVVQATKEAFKNNIPKSDKQD